MQCRLGGHVFTCILSLLLTDLVLSSVSSISQENGHELPTENSQEYDSASSASNFRARRAPKANVFMGMRGKKSSFDDCIDSGEEMEADGSSRGQEEDLADIDYLLARNDPLPIKRYNGFIGMRGKKTYGLPMGFVPANKRGSTTGFVGMRGKKIRIEDGSKRAPNNAFFAMRGKRQSLPTEQRDKREVGPCLLRAVKRPVKGAFIGMRGKKSSENVDSWENNRLDD